MFIIKFIESLFNPNAQFEKDVAILRAQLLAGNATPQQQNFVVLAQRLAAAHQELNAIAKELEENPVMDRAQLDAISRLNNEFQNLSKELARTEKPNGMDTEQFQKLVKSIAPQIALSQSLIESAVLPGSRRPSVVEEDEKAEEDEEDFLEADVQAKQLDSDSSRRYAIPDDVDMEEIEQEVAKLFDELMVDEAEAVDEAEDPADAAPLPPAPKHLKYQIPAETFAKNIYAVFRHMMLHAKTLTAEQAKLYQNGLQAILAKLPDNEVLRLEVQYILLLPENKQYGNFQRLVEPLDEQPGTWKYQDPQAWNGKMQQLLSGLANLIIEHNQPKPEPEHVEEPGPAAAAEEPPAEPVVAVDLALILSRMLDQLSFVKREDYQTLTEPSYAQRVFNYVNMEVLAKLGKYPQLQSDFTIDLKANLNDSSSSDRAMLLVLDNRGGEAWDENMSAAVRAFIQAEIASKKPKQDEKDAPEEKPLEHEPPAEVDNTDHVIKVICNMLAVLKTENRKITRDEYDYAVALLNTRTGKISDAGFTAKLFVAIEQSEELKIRGLDFSKQPESWGAPALSSINAGNIEELFEQYWKFIQRCSPKAEEAKASAPLGDEAASVVSVEDNSVITIAQLVLMLNAVRAEWQKQASDRRYLADFNEINGQIKAARECVAKLSFSGQPQAFYSRLHDAILIDNPYRGLIFPHRFRSEAITPDNIALIVFEYSLQFSKILLPQRAAFASAVEDGFSDGASELQRADDGFDSDGDAKSEPDPDPAQHEDEDEAEDEDDADADALSESGSESSDAPSAVSSPAAVPVAPPPRRRAASLTGLGGGRMFPPPPPRRGSIGGGTGPLPATATTPAVVTAIGGSSPGPTPLPVGPLAPLPTPLPVGPHTPPPTYPLPGPSAPAPTYGTHRPTTPLPVAYPPSLPAVELQELVSTYFFFSKIVNASDPAPLARQEGATAAEKATYLPQQATYSKAALFRASSEPGHSSALSFAIDFRPHFQAKPGEALHTSLTGGGHVTCESSTGHRFDVSRDPAGQWKAEFDSSEIPRTTGDSDTEHMKRVGALMIEMILQVMQTKPETITLYGDPIMVAVGQEFVKWWNKNSADYAASLPGGVVAHQFKIATTPARALTAAETPLVAQVTKELMIEEPKKLYQTLSGPPGRPTPIYTSQALMEKLAENPKSLLHLMHVDRTALTMPRAPGVP